MQHDVDSVEALGVEQPEIAEPVSHTSQVENSYGPGFQDSDSNVMQPEIEADWPDRLATDSKSKSKSETDSVVSSLAAETVESEVFAYSQSDGGWLAPECRICRAPLALRSMGVQTDSLTQNSQLVQTIDSNSSGKLPPRLPLTPPLRPKPRSISSVSSTSSDALQNLRMEVRSESSMGSQLSSSQLSSVGSELSHNDLIDIILGGGDEKSFWEIGDDGFWHRSSSNIVRLQELCALPRDSLGERTSFGSLEHLIAKGRCKRCVFHRKRGSTCSKGALCMFCHGDHQTPTRMPRPNRPGSSKQSEKTQ